MSIYRILHKIRYFHKDIYWFFQRHIRGYSDADPWNCYDFLGVHILKTLRAFKESNRAGIPTEFSGKEEEWEAILTRMVNGWDFLINGEDRFFEKNRAFFASADNKLFLKKWDEYAKDLEQAKKDAALFIEYFHTLWD